MFEDSQTTSVLHPVLKQHSVRPGEIVVEVDEEHIHERTETLIDPTDPINFEKVKTKTVRIALGNRHFNFPPAPDRGQNKTQNFIRSRDVFMRRGPNERFSMDPALRSLDFVMGERIHLDMNQRIGRVTDAIFDEENAEHRRQLCEARSNMKGIRGLLVPSEYFEARLDSDEAFYSWLFHFRKLLDGDSEHNSGDPRHRGCALTGVRLCRPVQNVHLLPTLAEILRSSKVTVPIMRPLTKDEADDFDKEHKADEFYRPIDRKRMRYTLTPSMCGLTNGHENDQLFTFHKETTNG